MTHIYQLYLSSTSKIDHICKDLWHCMAQIRLQLHKFIAKLLPNYNILIEVYNCHHNFRTRAIDYKIVEL